MKHFFTLLSHEIRMLLVSPSTYIAAVLFLAVMGFVFTGILDTYSQAPQETSPASDFFRLFFLPVFILVPLMTMKSLAEERRLCYVGITRARERLFLTAAATRSSFGTRPN